MKVYLDVCCLNRPFDDLTQPRTIVEAAAVTAVLQLIDAGRMTDFSSEMAQVEIDRIQDEDRRRRVASLLPPPARIISLTEDLLDAAEELTALGFHLADAVHLVAARRAGVDAFLTVDDRLLRRAGRHASRIALRVVDPVQFLEES